MVLIAKMITRGFRISFQKEYLVYKIRESLLNRFKAFDNHKEQEEKGGFTPLEGSQGVHLHLYSLKKPSHVQHCSSTHSTRIPRGGEK